MAPAIGLAKPEPVSRLVYSKIRWDRISPAELLWPEEFRGSNWNEAGWLGYDAQEPIEEVRRRYKLEDDWKPGAAKLKTLADEVKKERQESSDDLCTVTRIWYYASRYKKDVVHPEEIHVCVYVDGKDEPVEDGPAHEQEWVPGASIEEPGYWRGITALPIRVKALTYVSDLAVPPSDSEVGRAGVRETMRFRSQMLRQRDHSIPIRWYDVNRLDETVASGLRSGTWQDMIPVNGPGDRVIGEVSRANYPRENFEFARVVSYDLDRAWGQSANQIGAPQDIDRSATEVAEIAEAHDVDLAYQKEKVNQYVTEGAAQMFGLMQRYKIAPEAVEVVGEQGATTQEPVDQADFDQHFEFDFVADSSDRLSATAKQKRSLKNWELMGNAPESNRRELMSDVYESQGMDPERFIMPPDPAPKSEPPNVSYRFNGADLLNPIALALMMKANPVSQDELAAAAKVLSDAQKLQEALMLTQPGVTAAGREEIPAVPGAVPGDPEGVSDLQGSLGAPAPVDPVTPVPSMLKRSAVDGTQYRD